MAGARPPSTTIGEPFWSAEPMALMPLVTPGPAVSAQAPVWRVALAHPSAAKAADCSWRVSTMSMPSSRQPSKIEKMWPPERVKSFVTPWALSRLATSLPAVDPGRLLGLLFGSHGRNLSHRACRPPPGAGRL